jgi:uncharacterized protein (DUF58 family)
MKDKVFDEDFYRKLENISIKARMTLSDGAAGGRKSKAKGSSVEFSDFREYTPGDDFRRIDWNAYGRFDRLFLRLFMEEREALLNIFLDCSRSMDFGDKNKAAMALRIAAVLAYLALNNLDRVCLNRLQDNTVVPSSSYMGKSSFQRALQYLEATDFSGLTNLSDCIKRRELKSRGIAVVISDFFTEGSVEEAVKYLAYKKQQAVFIQILCDEEINPPLEGQMRLVDSETGNEMNLTVNQKLLKIYSNKLKSMQMSIKAAAKKYGGVFFQVSSSESLEKVVFEHFNREGII